MRTKFLLATLFFTVVFLFFAVGTSSTVAELDKSEAEHRRATQEIQRIIDERNKAAQLEAAGACDSPFGSLTGIGNGVPAFSNCNDNTISMDDDIILWDPVEKRVYYPSSSDEQQEGPAAESKTKPPAEEVAQRLQRVDIGMKWQCVNYARRYLAEKIGLVFQDCTAASEIWRMTFLFEPLDRSWQTRYELQRFPNFATGKVVNERVEQFSNTRKQRPLTPAERAPKPHDLVIWPMQKDMPFGHVAVVTEVLPQSHPRCKELACGSFVHDAAAREESLPKGGEGKDTLIAVVRIAEQNYANKPWPGTKTHARELHLYRQADTNRIGLKDPDGYRTLGWMRSRADLGVFKGAYSHPDNGEGVQDEGLLPRVGDDHNAAASASPAAASSEKAKTTPETVPETKDF